MGGGREGVRGEEETGEGKRGGGEETGGGEWPGWSLPINITSLLPLTTMEYAVYKHRLGLFRRRHLPSCCVEGLPSAANSDGPLPHSRE